MRNSRLQGSAEPVQGTTTPTIRIQIWLVRTAFGGNEARVKSMRLIEL